MDFRGNFKKYTNVLCTKAAKHNKSRAHQKATEGVKLAKTSLNVQELINVHSQTQIEEKQIYLKCLMRLAYFLFKNEIPYTTNWKALVNTAFSVDLSDKLNSCILSFGKNVNYLSSKSITIFLNCFGKALERKFINDFKNITNYSIMCDDAKSIKNENILSVYIRCLYNNQIIERFLESRKLTSTKSVNIKNEILTILDKFGLDKIKMISVSFDGASNFSGNKEVFRHC